MNTNHCQFQDTCHSIRFDYNLQVYNDQDYDGMTVMLSYRSPEVIHYQTYISYTWQNFIGEVGGILGLTLGISGLSLIDMIFEFYNFLRLRNESSNTDS